jgi:peptidoglycan hydrolase CwlO-like protein
LTENNRITQLRKEVENLNEIYDDCSSKIEKLSSEVWKLEKRRESVLEVIKAKNKEIRLIEEGVI